ncbi:MAG: hypothetical protein AAGA12_00770 [Pseudomonadota bacterium]
MPATTLLEKSRLRRMRAIRTTRAQKSTFGAKRIEALVQRVAHGSKDTTTIRPVSA